MKPNDKPTLNIFAVMNEHQNVPPADWKGYHNFDE